MKAHPLLSDARIVEPIKRMVGGRYGWAVHRFPIKGGKTIRETVWADGLSKLAANVTRNNSLLGLLTKRVAR